MAAAAALIAEFFTVHIISYLLLIQTSTNLADFCYQANLRNFELR